MVVGYRAVRSAALQAGGPDCGRDGYGLLGAKADDYEKRQRLRAPCHRLQAHAWWEDGYRGCPIEAMNARSLRRQYDFEKWS